MAGVDPRPAWPRWTVDRTIPSRCTGRPFASSATAGCCSTRRSPAWRWPCGSIPREPEVRAAGDRAREIFAELEAPTLLAQVEAALARPSACPRAAAGADAVTSTDRRTGWRGVERALWSWPSACHRRSHAVAAAYAVPPSDPPELIEAYVRARALAEALGFELRDDGHDRGSTGPS